MNRQEIIDYFDEHASSWDDEMIRDDELIGIILDNAGVGGNSRVLDVACGTGVLIPDYLTRSAEAVTAVDISPEMIRIAGSKFSQKNVRFICGNAETDEIGDGYTSIVIYNAFPHFPEPDKLIARLSSLLAPNGILTVAHGMSREKIDMHHHGCAAHVSMGLMPVYELKEIFEKYLDVITVISDERMYQVAGRRRA